MTTLTDVLTYLALEFLEKAENVLDQRIQEQAEKERSRKLRDGSIDVEFKVK